LHELGFDIDNPERCAILKLKDTTRTIFVLSEDGCIIKLRAFRFVIFQSSTAAIAEKSPSEMMKYMEEIANTTRLRRKMEELVCLSSMDALHKV
tara:strand:- start:1084 stop:1365 length:282 start_codon:yes stop_codon:yes gene_type:complete